LAVGCWLLAISNWQLAIGYSILKLPLLKSPCLNSNQRKSQISKIKAIAIKFEILKEK